MEFKTLDIFLYTGHSIISKAIRLLTSIRYGIPYKECRSHIDIRYNDRENISSEPSGVRLVKFENSKRHNDITVYRFSNIPDLKKFYEIADFLLNRKYAYARYLLDSARIFSFVFGICGVILSLFSWQINAGFFIALLILQFISIWLREMDIQTSDCAEASAIILNVIGLITLFSGKARNEFPNGIEDKIRTLEIFGMSKKIYEWDHKTGQEKIFI